MAEEKENIVWKRKVMIVDRQVDSVKIGFKIFDSKFANRQEQKTKK